MHRYIYSIVVLLLLASHSAYSLDGQQWCTSRQYLDMHVHENPLPLGYGEEGDDELVAMQTFIDNMDAMQASVAQHSGSASIIVNLDGAKWWSEKRAEEPNIWPDLTITGIVMLQRLNFGQTSVGGHTYPQTQTGTGPNGDPLDFINQYHAYGVRAIKFLNKPYSGSGIDAIDFDGDGDNEHVVGMCGRFSDGTLLDGVFPFYQAIEDYNGSESVTNCADYNDDTVRLGKRINGTDPHATWLQYFIRAAELGLNVVVHGEDKIENADGTNLMGTATIADVVDKVVQAGFDDFKVLMFHGPNLGVSAGLGLNGSKAVDFTNGLFWGPGGTRLSNTANDGELPYAEESGEGEKQDMRDSLHDHLSGFADPAMEPTMYDAPGNFIFGTDTGNPLADNAERSYNAYALLLDLFQEQDNPWRALPKRALFCRHGAAFLGLD